MAQEIRRCAVATATSRCCGNSAWKASELSIGRECRKCNLARRIPSLTGVAGRALLPDLTSSAKSGRPIEDWSRDLSPRALGTANMQDRRFSEDVIRCSGRALDIVKDGTPPEVE